MGVEEWRSEARGGEMRGKGRRGEVREKGRDGKRTVGAGEGRGYIYLCVLEDGFLINVLVLARVLDVGLHPTDVFTATKTPLFKALEGGGRGEH